MTITPQHIRQLVAHLEGVHRQQEESKRILAAISATIKTNIQAIAEAVTNTEPVSSKLDSLAQALGQIAQLSPASLNGLYSAAPALDQIGGIALAQQITGKSTSTIYSLVSMGKLPATKAGGKLYFSESALRQYISQPRTSRKATGG
ncbi:helix-turn-helix domain-containing protein [Spirosoma pollinicola]|uniref:Helix-turn-helix domain-containing protein n=1 Tax=Spirosoma pollinicola TaxID=2057025 RepID=A0A2K8ZAY4_9BACT|nr:helix-turn-helix domain-containing protein [Spirosoma pollinicola]AUD07004.1 hypothetical protein CWM47_37405 [Spirosoma pollinicola]